MAIKKTYQLKFTKTLYASAFFYVIFLFSFAICKSQPTIVLTDSTDNIFIGKSILYLEDPENKLSYPEITDTIYNKAFKICTQESPNFGNVQNTIWNKFSIKNESGKKWLLSVLNYNIDTLALYYTDKELKTVTTTYGTYFPFSARKIKSGNYVFELPLAPHDSLTFYLKVQSYLLQYPILISNEAQFIYDLNINTIFKGLYYGLVLMFIIYSTVLFFTLKDRNYLYFVLNIFFTALLMSEFDGFNAILWGDSLQFLWGRGPLIVAIGSFFFLMFSKSFLNTKTNTPKSHFVIRFIFMPAVLLCMLLNLFNFNLYASLLNQTSGFAILVFMAFTAVAIYRKGFRPARFYILACSFYFIGVSIFILKSFAILPFNYFTSNAMHLGSALEMILFSMSMADRMNTFKREKEIAQMELVDSLQQNEILITEQNKMLEIKVEERTTELKHTLGELEISQQQLEQKNIVITKEKERSDVLLLNILPEEVAEELKQKGSADAKQFEEVTVMFTDFKDFTKISEKLSPTDLVNEIHTCFKAFDEIITKYNIEKIKTIGDAYMCAGGLPVQNSTNALDVVNAAIEIRDFITMHLNERAKAGKEIFEIRIGIHTGPVVAGIVGVKKFAYDIWGDTVNTASRLESSGEPGKINISGTTYERIKTHYNCTYRGKIQAKNKGEIDMYFVDSII